MNILITGGAGFVGYHLAWYHVMRGDNISIVDNLSKVNNQPEESFQELARHPSVRAYTNDLTQPIEDLDAPAHLDIVYHLAAINGTRLFYEIPYRIARANLLMTLNLLRWMEGKSVGRLVYASTSEVYAGGESVGLLRIPSDESTPVVFPQPTNVRFSYGASKFMGEFLCLHFGKAVNTPVSVVRYHNVYGPRMGDKHVIPEFIARLKARENPFRVYGGSETRAFCYVSDVVEATHAVAIAPSCDQEITHIGNSAEEITIENLARLMMRQFGVELELKECGRRSGSVSRRCPDTSKLRRLTGFEPKVDLVQGLTRTIEWYLAHDEA